MNKERVKKCKVCGNEFSAKSNNSKYCSEKCRRSVVRKNRIDNRLENPMKKGFVEDMKMLYSFKCAICSWSSGSTESDGCELHHIEEVQHGGDNTQKNVILLCPNCHKKVHLGLISKVDLVKFQLKSMESYLRTVSSIIGD